MKDVVKALGYRIRALRNEANMSQEELSYKAGLNAAHLGQIERGLKKPTIETINQISEALEIPLNELFDLEQDNYFNSYESENRSVINKIVAQITPLSDDEQNDILKLIRIFKHYRDNEDE